MRDSWEFDNGCMSASKQFGQLRTAALLSPKAELMEIVSALQTKGFRPVVGRDEWTKQVQAALGCVQVVVRHNEAAPAFQAIQENSRRRIRITWFAFVENPVDRQELDGDRDTHIKIIDQECLGLFDMNSYNFAYNPVSR